MEKNSNRKHEDAKRAKISQLEVPRSTLDEALRVASALWDNFAGKGAPPHEIAMAIRMSPTSGSWRSLCGASIAYGLTAGGYNAMEISLTDLGRKIIAPTEDGGEELARVEAVLKPRVLKEFFQKYNRAKLPRDEIAQNVLTDMGIPKERAQHAWEILKENGLATGIIRETKTGHFVALDSPGAQSSQSKHQNETRSEHPENDQNVINSDESASNNGTQATPDTPDRPRQLFVAHGKNRRPLEDLKKVLDQFKIPYKVAIDEAHAGRPISKKVAELMQSCSAGIFIFTKDEKLKRDSGEEFWRPSENVVYELGAAGILWASKIIVLKENGVDFPSDFSDLGYITFDDGEIATKALDLLRELVALQLVRVQAA